MSTSTFTDEALAEGLAFSLPGFRLANFTRVGLPIFRVSLECIFLASKSLRTIDEFVLKCINADLNDPLEISAFLGLETRLVLESAAGLQITDDVYYSNDRLTLTPKGRQTLATADQVVPETKAFSVVFDGLARRCEYIPYDKLMSAFDADEKQIAQIPPSPNRPPRVSDFPIQDLDGYINSISSLVRGSSSTMRLLAVKKIEKTQLLFRPALALIFRSDSGDCQIELAVDGRIVPNQTRLFRQGSFSLKRDIMRGLSDSDSLSSLLGELPQDVVNRLPSKENIRDIKEQMSLARQEVVVASSREERASDASEVALAREELKVANNRYSEASRKRDQLQVWTLSSFEHIPFLRQAFKKSKERIVIVSPNLSKKVLEARFSGRISSVLKKGVKVTLVTLKSNQRLLEGCLEKQAKNENLVYKTLENPPAFSIIAYDHEAVLYSTIDWFTSRPNEDYRDYRGVCVSIKSVVDQAFDDYS